MKEEMKDAVKEAFKDMFGPGEFFVPLKDHYEDHQFTQSQRKAIGFIKKGALTAIGIGLAGGLIWAVKEWIRLIG